VGARAVIVRRFRFLPPRAFAVVMFLVFQKRFSTLRDPRTFTELLAARNASGHDPLVTRTADKYAVREHVAAVVGGRYLVPLRQVVEHADELDLAALEPPCVVKATHGYDMTLLLPRGHPVDLAEVRATATRWLGVDFYRDGYRERSYRGLRPRVVVEDFVGDGVHAPPDWKFWVFGGRVGLVQVDHGRFGGRTSTVLDPEWHEIAAEQPYERPAELPSRPIPYAEMLAVAEQLGAAFPFARVDLYDDGGRVRFGEITHYPGGGMHTFGPPELDRALGEMWRLGTPLPARLRTDRSA
jgi:hypothetical protein